MILIAIALTGCAAATRVDIVARPDAPEFRDEIAFWNRVDRVPLVSNADAVYAMSLYAPAGFGDDYAARVVRLKKSGLLPHDFDAAPDAALDRGTLARFVASAINLPRGVNATLFGWNARYAIRELEFRGLLPPSSPNQLVSGAELIGILARANDYEQLAITPAPGIAPPQPQSDERPPSSDGPLLPAADASPLPGVQLASRALEGMLLLQDAPATSPAGARFVVTAVTGKVSVRPAAGAAFVAAAVGAELTDATEISTGLRASVTLSGPNDQTVLLKQLTRTTLRQVVSTGGVNVTKLDLERGQAGAEIDTTVIEGAGQKYDLQIESPRSTLAIKGTRVALYDQRPYDVEAKSFTGTAVFESFQRQRVAFGRKNGGTVTVTGNTPDPTGVALAASVSDPGVRAARTQSESSVIANFFSRTRAVRFDPVLQLPVVTGGPVFGPGASLQPFFTGDLGLGITWNSATNLQIAAFEIPGDNSRGRFVLPVREFARQPGATIPFDHRGGENGGFEVANFDAPKVGRFTVLVTNPGDRSATVDLTAFAGRQRLSFYNPFSQQNEQQPSRRLAPDGNAIYLLFFGEDPPPSIELPEFPFAVRAQKARSNRTDSAVKSPTPGQRPGSGVKTRAAPAPLSRQDLRDRNDQKRSNAKIANPTNPRTAERAPSKPAKPAAPKNRKAGR